jgi:hypothetical protein
VTRGSVNSLGSANGLAFAAGATERMRLTAAGNVGIGTTTPQELLEVAGSAARIRIADTGTTNPAVAQPIIEFGYGTGTANNGYVGGVEGDIEIFGNRHARMGCGGSAFFSTWTGNNFHVRVTSNPSDTNLGEGAVILYSATPPSGSPSNGVVLFAQDISASSELRVRDEAGNVTTLSPHNFEGIPDGPSEDMAWAYHSEKEGRSISVDMLKAIRVLERLSGEQLVHIN